ncbi:MAG: GCN5-related N-acetyltransferase [uncultured bacterium]|nr:MAG: GCN5-related N-acetyltransferase [uncultured bacterium]
MNIKQIDKSTVGIKVFVEEDGIELGRAWLYLIYNDLHAEPYGLLEDVYVKEDKRGQGVGKKLLEQILSEAKKRKCYKIIGTSRMSRDMVHEWYKRLGFREYGLEFRMDLN